MDILKKLFPISFKFTQDAGSLIVGVLIYLVVGIVGGFALGLIGVLSIVPILGWILALVLGLIGSLLDIYCLAGIIIEVLVYTKVLK